MRKSALLAHELDRYSVDIAALSETRFSGEGSVVEGDNRRGYTIFWRGYPTGQPRIHGVGLAIKNSLLKNITEEPTYTSERLMTLRMPLVKGEHALIICAYAPTLSAEEDLKDQFYSDLSTILRGANRRDKILLLGDFNARVGDRSDLWDGVIGPHGIGKMNANGLRLLSICSEYDLAITNTLFKLKNKYKTSWMHPRSRQWHLIDYIIVRKSQVKDTMITRAMRGAECWTDHRLMVSKMNIKIRPPIRKNSKPNKKVNCAALKDGTKRDLYAVRVRELVSSTTFASQNEFSSEEWDSFSAKLLSEAIDILGFQTRKHRDWFDDNNVEICSMLKAKNKAHTACISNPSSIPLRQRFSKIRAEVQSKLRQLEDLWWRNLASEIQGYADTNDMQKFYDATKKIYGPTKRCNTPVRSADGSTLIKNGSGILERWAEHYCALLNHHTSSDHSVLEELPNLEMHHELDTAPNLEEVRSAILALKRNKSPGPDSIPSELLAYGGEPLHRLMHEILLKIWSSQSIPQKWKDAVLISIYKNKGDRAMCGSSRGIALLATAGKVLAKILLRRLVSISENVLPESQCGFRSERSTVDMVFAARQLMEKCREQHQDLYIAFVDLSKAFDSVDRKLLWEVLGKCGCPPRFVNIVRQLHDGMNVCVSVAGELSEPFAVSRGVKQGCVLAPVLFNMYVQCITRLLAATMRENAKIVLNYRTDRNLFDLSKLKAKTKISQCDIIELQYADDCALVAHTAEELQLMLAIMSNFYQKLGLGINVQKTEVMRYCALPTDIEEPIVLNGASLKQVNSFKYLGSHLSATCQLDDELQYRIGQASGAFGRLRARVFNNHCITLKTKVLVYHAVCISALLYGSESWTLYRRQVKMLEAFHIRCLQQMMGITWKDRVPHSDILKQTHCVSLETILKRNQLRWIGHVIRMTDDRLPKRFLYGELVGGARSSGGQIKRYKDNAKLTLRSCNISPDQLEELAQDRQNWRSMTNRGLEEFESRRHEWLRERRERRHRTTTGPTGGEYMCNKCGRPCTSRIGLSSHMRAHQRREEESRVVIVGHDGPT